MTQSALPGLTAARAVALEGTWNDGGMWEDVMWLSRRCWRGGSPEEQILQWHHLLLAIGNFKRQGGRMSPPPISGIPDYEAVRAEVFPAPSLGLLRDEEDSWRELLKTPGVALATATTLLAALWPEHHFIFDWRVQAAADALRVQAGLDPTPKTQREIELRKLQRPSFEDYRIVRGWLKDTGIPLRTAERALYRLSQGVPTVKGRSWSDYATAVASRLETVSSPDHSA